MFVKAQLAKEFCRLYKYNKQGDQKDIHKRQQGVYDIIVTQWFLKRHQNKC
jgi:hypothetical protein